MHPAPAIYAWLWLEPVIPFASSLALLAGGGRIRRRMAAILGTGSIAASFVIALLIGLAEIGGGGVSTQIVWHWIAVSGFNVRVALYLDPLAVVMTLVVTFVSFLIHLYSTEYMRASEGYQRFFAYMNLFVASMLTLTLASNLLLLFLGWEGVGLCSYLLIGFWYTDEANGYAGRKAFIVTRVGDTAMILGLVLLMNRLGTLNIQALLHQAVAQWPIGSGWAETAAFLLLGGAVGKSAQLPLQTWLPDAMAGPTPTSALIHAATMVTAGVYLIARMHLLFELAPYALDAVALIGFATLLMAGCSALVQTDIKRILAYSTISQIGYMFLALGVGAWTAAIFHLVTHAFFKALLFLGAGAVIHALDEEHNIFNMGGLRQKMPVTFWTFLLAGSSLAGLPLITAGFYSKGMILWASYAGPRGTVWLWIGGLVGAFLTALYIFRLIFIVFYGPLRRAPSHLPHWPMQYPMMILAFLSVAAGYIDLSPALGGNAMLSRYLAPALPPVETFRAVVLSELGAEAIAAGVFFVGLFIIFALTVGQPGSGPQRMMSGVTGAIRRFWFVDWGMDWLYNFLFVRPVTGVSRAARRDPVDAPFAGAGAVAGTLDRLLSRTASGSLRRYAAWIAAGAIGLIFLVVLR